MAHLQSNKPGRQTDEYGNTMKDTIKDAVPGLHGKAGTGYETHNPTGTGYGTGAPTSQGGGGGVAGGMTEKIKDVVPGLHGQHDATGKGHETHGGGGVTEKKNVVPGLDGHNQQAHHVGPTPASTGEYGLEGQPKKGIVEKVKDKLPGHHQ